MTCLGKRLPYRRLRCQEVSKSAGCAVSGKRMLNSFREMEVEEVNQFLFIEIFNNNQMYDQYYLFDIHLKIINDSTII